MTDSFRQRIPTLSDDQLRAYLNRPGDYRYEAVEAAAAELRRRGRGPSEAEWQALLARRTPPPAGPDPARMRALARWTLLLGLGAAVLLYVRAQPAAEALVDDPMDSKRYLRELAVFGGKANVLATQFRQWFEGLWQGRNLAYTVAALSAALAGVFRLLGREPRA